eukprot:511162-Hanusia_phi.AAC.1
MGGKEGEGQEERRGKDMRKEGREGREGRMAGQRWRNRRGARDLVGSVGAEFFFDPQGDARGNKACAIAQGRGLVAKIEVTWG